MICRTYKDYRVEISEELTYSADSVDNTTSYDLVYKIRVGTYRPGMCGVRVFRDDQEIKSALILVGEGAACFIDNSAFFEDDRVLLCCSNHIVCLTLPDLRMDWATRGDSVCCFYIFRLGRGYLIHGELELAKLNRQGEIEWRFAGADILTSVEIKDDHILVTDWNKDQYKIDFKGNRFRTSRYSPVLILSRILGSCSKNNSI